MSVEEVAGAAVGIAEEKGLSELSMSRLAERLGVSTMALYRYVPGKAELVEVMLDLTIGDAVSPSVADASGGVREKLEILTRRIFAVYNEHPWMVQVSISGPPFGPNTLAWLESVLAVTSRTGLEDHERLYVAELLSGYARGAAQVSVGLTQSEPHTGTSPEQWGPVFAGLLKRVVEDRRFPELSGIIASGTFGGPGDSSEDFEFGLQRVLDGIEVFIRRCSARADQQ